MKVRLKHKKLIRDILGVVAVLAIVAVIFAFMNTSRIQFVSDCKIEINSVVDYTKFVKDIKNGDVNKLKIDSSKVNVEELGEYKVVYKYEDEERTLTVKVVDSTPPEFDIQPQSIAVNQTLEPQYLVKNIKDATKTKVAFKKKYIFDKVGEQEVEVVVTDTSGNETTKKVKVKVAEDKSAPEIITGNMSVVVGTDTDLKKFVTLKDDFDKSPQLTIEDGGFDAHKKGTYKVKFIAKDASGNQSDKTIAIQVVDKTDKNEKVVYLTFDDGPSRHTSDVLDILERYNCKATFFITGMNTSYRKYIKIAHDKGHTIGLHTYTHNYSKVYASVDAYFEDLEKVGNLAKDYIGFVPKYIRFPGGGSNTVSRKYSKGIMSKLTKMVGEKGYIYYDWNAENGDGYSHMAKSQMLKRATSSTANQIMILMHDANGKQNTIDILPQVIEHYQKLGYTFKAIDDSSIVPHQHVNN